MLATFLVLSGCSSGSDEERQPDTDRLTTLLGELAGSPDEAQALLTDRAEGALADRARQAGAPDHDVAAWLVAVDDAGVQARLVEVLTAATAPAKGEADERAAERLFTVDRVEPASRAALAELLVARTSDVLSSVRDGAPWPPEAVRAALRLVVDDEAVHERVVDGWAEASTAMLGTTERQLPLLRALGLLVGTADGLAYADLSEPERRSLVDTRRLALETRAEKTLRATGSAPRAAQAAAALVSSAYSDGLAG